MNPVPQDPGGEHSGKMRPQVTPGPPARRPRSRHALAPGPETSRGPTARAYAVSPQGPFPAGSGCQVGNPKRPPGRRQVLTVAWPRVAHGVPSAPAGREGDAQNALLAAQVLKSTRGWSHTAEASWRLRPVTSGHGRRVAVGPQPQRRARQGAGTWSGSARWRRTAGAHRGLSVRQPPCQHVSSLSPSSR